MGRGYRLQIQPPCHHLNWGREQPCSAVPRPQGSWRGVPRNLLHPPKVLKEERSAAAAACSRKTSSSKLTSRGQARPKIRQNSSHWKGRGPKQARKLLRSPNNTENSEGAPEPAGSRNKDPEGVPPRLRQWQKVGGRSKDGSPGGWKRPREPGQGTRDRRPARGVVGDVL